MKLGCVSNLINVPAGADPALARIARSPEFGIQVLNINFREPFQRDPGYLRNVADAAAKIGLELRLFGVGGPFGSADPEERKAAVDETVESILVFCRGTGMNFSSLVNRPMPHNRWAPNPPMNERIDIIAENLAKVADAVAGDGIRLALENHCDYRGHEIAAMLAKANRPNLGAQIDTGNAFTVFEEPVDCAKALAKYTFSSHFKDVQVIPLSGAPYYGSRCIDCVFGEGHVDNKTICKILQAEAPDPRDLALMIEPLTLPPDVDRDRYLKTALTWCRNNLAEYLN